MTQFNELLAALKKHPNSLSPNEAHGFLTAVNVAPDSIFDLPWMQTLLGLSPQIDENDIPVSDRDLILAALDTIEHELLIEEYQPVTTSSEYKGKLLPDTHEWARGFLKVIEMHPKDWEAISEQNMDFARNILAINTMCNPEKFANIVFGDAVDPNDPEFIQELRSNTGALAQSMFDKVMEADVPSIDDEQVIEEIDLIHRELSADNLRDYSDDELYDLLFTYQDSLPLTVVDEFAHREPQMLPVMATYADNLNCWLEDYADEGQWLLLNHVFILGKMSSQEAARQLMVFLTNRKTDIYDSRWDWVAGYWPALFGNKTKFVEKELVALATDTNIENSNLYDYFSILLGYARQNDTDTFEAFIDLLAQRLQSIKDRELCYLLANLLLDLPRDRHYELLLHLAKEQEAANPLGLYFSIDDVEAALMSADQPEFERFSNPWKFYDREEIIQRQLRWLEEDNDSDDLFEENKYLDTWLPDYELVETFVRQDPKIGRNDPCPCGSGKKYKKCCLH